LSDGIGEIKFAIVSRKIFRVSSRSVNSLLAACASLRYEMHDETWTTAVVVVAVHSPDYFRAD
jgi:hypothetical protein